MRNILIVSIALIFLKSIKVSLFIKHNYQHDRIVDSNEDIGKE